MIGILMCFMLVFPNIANASEDIQIYSSTQYAIDQAVAENKVEQEYLDDIIELFNNEIHTNSEDLNILLMDALNQSILMNEKTDDELELAQKAMDEIQEQKNDSDIRGIAPMASTAENLYIMGASLVANKGCPQTAAYMLHAKQANPPTYYNKNDEWAKKCALNGELFLKIEPQFQKQILETGKDYGTVSGTFAFTIDNSSLDQYTALHNVNYSVTFKKQSNGYSAVYNITDVYDFDWGKYDNFEVGFGNNYCYAMQVLGLINPFKISIIYNI